MKGLSRQALIDAVRSPKANDIPMLLPGVAVDGHAAGPAPVNITRMLQFGNGTYSQATTS
jgi:hypothetical protein